MRVALLELVEARSVHHARDHFPHVVRLADIGVDDSVNLLRVVRRLLRRRHIRRKTLLRVEGANDGSRLPQRVVIVFSEIVGDTGQPRVDVGAAKLLRRDVFAGRRFHKWGTTQKDRACSLHDDRFVGHRRHIGATGRARPHDDGDLRNAERRHSSLVVEDAAEVIAVGEDLRLQRQERAARVH